MPQRAALFAAILALPLALPGAGWAVGGMDDTPPKPTKTTTECADGTVWDADSKSCVDAQSSLIDDDTRYDAVRELAYAGRLGAAQTVLAAMSDQSAPRVQTYWGFTHRKLGNDRAAQNHYDRALAAAPDFHLARAYRAMGMADKGLIEEAREELFTIARLGGRETWAHEALTEALKGRFLDY